MPCDPQGPHYCMDKCLRIFKLSAHQINGGSSFVSDSDDNYDDDNNNTDGK